jgi:hypothetical protein
MSDEPYDRNYWGPGGVDVSRWGLGEVTRGHGIVMWGPPPMV